MKSRKKQKEGFKNFVIKLINEKPTNKITKSTKNIYKEQPKTENKLKLPKEILQKDEILGEFQEIIKGRTEENESSDENSELEIDNNLRLGIGGKKLPKETLQFRANLLNQRHLLNKQNIQIKGKGGEGDEDKLLLPEIKSNKKGIKDVLVMLQEEKQRKELNKIKRKEKKQKKEELDMKNKEDQELPKEIDSKSGEIGEEIIGLPIKRRFKTKTRSKQKNIRKDHRSKEVIQVMLDKKHNIHIYQ